MKRPIVELYNHYQIPENLKQHLLTVAAIGLTIVQNWDPAATLDNELILVTLLTHDLGNLAKFDLDSPLSRHYLGEQDLDYWRQRQQQFREKYGHDDHQANLKIVQELGLPQAVTEILKRQSFVNLPDLLQSVKPHTWETKICLYSDLRVTPSGLASIESRINDLQKRYGYRDIKWQNAETVKKWHQQSAVLEAQLNQKTTISLPDLSMKKIAPLITELTRYQIETTL